MAASRRVPGGHRGASPAGDVAADDHSGLPASRRQGAASAPGGDAPRGIRRGPREAVPGGGGHDRARCAGSRPIRSGPGAGRRAARSPVPAPPPASPVTARRPRPRRPAPAADAGLLAGPRRAAGRRAGRARSRTVAARPGAGLRSAQSPRDRCQPPQRRHAVGLPQRGQVPARRCPARTAAWRRACIRSRSATAATAGMLRRVAGAGGAEPERQRLLRSPSPAGYGAAAGRRWRSSQATCRPPVTVGPGGEGRQPRRRACGRAAARSGRGHRARPGWCRCASRGRCGRRCRCCCPRYLA